MLTTLKMLCNAPSVSGREENIREKISAVMGELCDETRIDNMGNLIAVKRSGAEGAKKVMLCAHMDEIGFLVTFIEDNGFLRIAAVGGINFSAAAYSELVSERGVVGICVPESNAKPEDYSASNFYVDIGAKSKKDAERRVKIGDFFVVRPSLTKLMGSRVAGRPLDDRVGCAVLIDVARKIKDTKLLCDVYFVFSVQEEVGCRGAKTAAFGIAPDYALAFDVTGAGDVIGSHGRVCDLGGGVGIKIKDASVICSKEVVDTLVSLAKENGIPYQCELKASGGTDTGSIQMSGAGAKVGALTVPTRYGHSCFEVCDMADMKDCSSLAVKFVENIK